LFGKAPAKHQQMADHYFGPIKTRIFEYMEDMDRELWKAGIPGRTRHNEVAPSQYEIAPVFEELNLGVDHNMLTMEIMQRVAEKHDLACLLHEKPFAHINGSGKHNNWSIVGPDGKNWLSPGDNPHENAKFLVTLCAIIKAVDKYADVLRSSVASAGNDHRLGSHEAPPAIISIFLGDQLTHIVEQIEKGDLKETRHGGTLKVGIDSLPDLPRDATDRNRTSPFAFTGAKFEFRAVGSNFSLAGPNIVLNSIVADAVCDICDQLEADKKAKKDFNISVEKVIRDIVKKHKRVIYNGDNYVAEWITEAERRGLPNLKNTPAALEALTTEKAIKLFEKHGVLSKRELNSRYEIYKDTYETTLTYEANLAVDMVRTMYLPAVSIYMKSLAETAKSVESVDIKAAAVKKVLAEVTKLYADGLEAVEKLEKAVTDGKPGLEKRALMDALRVVVDSLEAYVPKDLWPVPSYAEMLFVL
jgi:glutamine synthetase